MATATMGEELLSLALEFSPCVEQRSPDTVVFSITPLRKLIGSPHQVASEICLLGYERKIQANLALAANPDTAILLAYNLIGVTLVTPGEEYLKLAPFPLTCLFAHNLSDTPVDLTIAQVFHRWGLKTCEDLVLLPEKEVAERLGKAGVYLRNLASGLIHRPLHLSTAEIKYEERVQLDHPVMLFEPLLFLFARVLSELCKNLRSQSNAARSLEVKFELENPESYSCRLEFPVPLDDHSSILKLLQLQLERHSPGSSILAFTLRLEPAKPRRLQGDFFVPLTPPPDKLQITLARIAGMVGEENVGTPLLLDTHQQDAFAMGRLNFSSIPKQKYQLETSRPETIRLVMRLFRPALQAKVVVADCVPKYIAASGVRGNIIQSAGPWKTSGEWWTAMAWTHEEWDVALDDGALYRIYQQPQTQAWYVSGVYD